MSVPFALLGLLEQQPSHGYDLKRNYDAYFGKTRPVPFGQVYSTLSRLVRDGRVEAGEIESGSGPDRKRYAITVQGRPILKPGWPNQRRPSRTCRLCSPSR